MFGSLFGSKVPSTNANDLKERLAAGHKPVLLDVRQPEEHAQKNIPGSILIPLGDLGRRIGEIEKYKGEEIIVYCRSGSRSAMAVKALREQGYNAINLSGGIMFW